MSSTVPVKNVYAPTRIAIRRRVQKPNASSRLAKESRAGGELYLLKEGDAVSRFETFSTLQSAESGTSSRFVAQVLAQVMPSTSDAARAMRAYARARGCDPDARFIRFL